MEKYERDVKTSQLRKMAEKGDYETAMKIADSLDWKKEKDVSLLDLVSQVYEKNAEYQDATEILLMAYERAPVGKRFLYRLTELALKEGDIDEAEAFYREFCDVAGDDPRQYLLRYMILRARHAPISQQINALESYTSEELDERWMYELAELCSEAGDTEKCVSVCDKIMLMFGLGKYVDKAMELKMQYAELTPEQKDLMENREKYEQKLKAVEESFREEGDDEDYSGSTEDDDDYDDEDLRREAVIEADNPPESPDELGKTRVMSQLKRKLPQETKEAAGGSGAVSEETKTKADDSNDAASAKASEKAAAAEPVKASEPAEKSARPAQPKEHLMIEARTPEKGLDFALAVLKRTQKEKGVKIPVAKITGSNLNKKGILENVEKLTGRALIVEEAGDLSPASLKELCAMLDQHVEGTMVLLIDNERQLDMMLEREPDLSNYFDRVTVEEVQLPEEQEDVQETEPPEDEELDIDSFAQYACDYAASIDCSITGKSMLALYERIEIMEEDGIPLTRENAEDLIEEAADKAEKPGFVGSVKGIFSSKYNKDGLLILRESDFIS